MYPQSIFADLCTQHFTFSNSNRLFMAPFITPNYPLMTHPLLGRHAALILSSNTALSTPILFGMWQGCSLKFLLSSDTACLPIYLFLNG